MRQQLYRYQFSPSVPMDELEATIVLAIVCAECLHGRASARLDAAHFLDKEKRSCAIDAGTQVGIDLNRLFVGLVLNEFGPDSFQVDRVQKQLGYL